MSLETEVGRATVALLCSVFGLSRAAFYVAKREAQAQPSAEVITFPSPAQRPVPKAERWAPAEALREAIEAIAKAHPAWGVRKVHAVLRREPYGLCVGRKRVWAMMKSLGLCFAPGARPTEATRGSVAVELPNRRWATDLTTVWTKEDGTVAVVPVVDCGCRSVLQLGVTKAQASGAVLAPLRAALQEHFGGVHGVPEELELRTDHGPQFTGEDCRELCERWRLDHTFAPVGRPTGNAVVERLIRTMKEECIWLRDWTSLAELQAELERWQRVYNEQRPHQALNWRTPAEVRASITELEPAA
jgi:putative transposase